MIVRISEEGQYRVPDSALDELNRLDDTLLHTCTAKDEASFHAALKALLDRVRELGELVVPSADLPEPSDFVLPPDDATIDEVERMMLEDGLIPEALA